MRHCVARLLPLRRKPLINDVVVAVSFLDQHFSDLTILFASVSGIIVALLTYKGTKAGRADRAAIKEAMGVTGDLSLAETLTKVAGEMTELRTDCSKCRRELTAANREIVRLRWLLDKAGVPW